MKWNLGTVGPSSPGKISDLLQERLGSVLDRAPDPTTRGRIRHQADPAIAAAATLAAGLDVPFVIATVAGQSDVETASTSLSVVAAAAPPKRPEKVAGEPASKG